MPRCRAAPSPLDPCLISHIISRPHVYTKTRNQDFGIRKHDQMQMQKQIDLVTDLLQTGLHDSESRLALQELHGY